ncbi:microtubule-associated protein 70-5-like isoform X2 [Neltuma alba]|uniref:microtubule-associated protein 70-5-like isoform X2 n=1 Tax=Neltuma alba TaxID=207710 RepID=UPI0010A33EE8|nr:microtubule-associated protein 70-5-like isoform X2 [Prosopis alba]
MTVSKMVGYEEHHAAEDVPHVQPDPFVLETDHLQNQLKEKLRELATCQSEIKASRATESLKDKAIEELRTEVNKLEEKLRVAEDIVEHKNLEVKKLSDEKKDALAAQYAAETTLRRLHANQKDDESVPVHTVIAPLEAEIKMCKNEIAALQEDKKALERLTKTKESALLEAERILRSALDRALIVEEVQNQNFDLKRQIEICKEENKILEKTHRQKVLEVEKLSQTIEQLEEVILASGATANAVRDYQRQISELQEEKRTLERELARIKVSANRVATVVANEWKDENEKVMPVKQWLEERRIMQAEMQRMKDKLAISDRTAKAEAQLKDKLKLRLKTLEEGMKNISSQAMNSSAASGSPKVEKSNILGFLTSSGALRKRSTSQPRASSVGGSLFHQPNIKINNDNNKAKYGSVENAFKKGIWVSSRSKVADSGEKENETVMQMKHTDIMNLNVNDNNNVEDESKCKISSEVGGDENDVVSGFLYDKLQKEVISLRKYCEAKDCSLQAKDEEIKMLMKKVEALSKAMELEWKKTKREAAAREKETATTKVDDNKTRRSMISSKRVMKER